jgi:hypothetical protein
MITDCAEISVLYNNSALFGVRFHKVPRSLFDLIPGNEREVTTSDHPLWVKTMMLAAPSTAGVPGEHVEMTMYCNEAAGFPLTTRGNDGAVQRLSSNEF